MERKIISQTPDNSGSFYNKDVFETSEKSLIRNRLEFLALAGIELDSKSFGAELLDYLAVKMLEIIQKGLVVVVVYDLDKGTWKVSSVKGLDFIDKKFINMLGASIESLEGKVLSNRIDSMKIGKLGRLIPDFKELDENFLDKKLGEKIIQLANIDGLYSIPFATAQNYFGTLTLICFKDTPVLDKELIEAFVLQFSAFYEKKVAQNQRDLSEIKYYKLFDAANVGVSVSTKDGRILEANKAACEIIEVNKEELKNLRVKDLYYLEENRLDLISKISEKGEVDNFPIRFMAKSGKIKWINLSLKSIFVEDEECYISTLIDITNTKEMELALLSNEKELKKYIDESPLSISIVTKEGEVEYLNERVTAVFGYTKEDVKTMDQWWEKAFSDEETRKRAINMWYQIIKQGHIQVNSSVICKNGDRKYIELYTTTVGDKVIAMFSDQTEKFMLEQENLNYRENLEELVKNRTAELEEKNQQLEKMNELFVGREFRIKELKDKIKNLEAGQAKK
ncbi:MAG: PAS domain S-box protein [Prolixibacteraceae bacterium]|nr:PAS domain S-box protein [Prolixibacteraceae bacterium]